MPRYLFMFGYETPRQYESNRQCGWDDEDSFALFVEAPDEALATRRGAEIAESYVRWLFDRAGWMGPIPSWSAGNFAYGIERNPERLGIPDLGALPVVSCDETPDFENWRT